MTRRRLGCRTAAAARDPEGEIRLHWDDKAYFSSMFDEGLYCCRFLAAERWHYARSEPSFREGLRCIADWKELRRRCRRLVEKRAQYLDREVHSARRKLQSSIARGRLEPGDGSAQRLALRGLLRQVQGARRGAVVTGLRAIRLADGSISREPGVVHRELQVYGAQQNRASSANLEAFRGLLRAFVPAWPELTLSDGRPWTLREAIPFSLFLEAVRKARRGKAAALHPFVIELLQVLPSEALPTYYELMMRCMEAGEYPSHYSELIGVLIPKSYGDQLHPSNLRDIWLSQHGAKLVQGLSLRSALTPLSDRYLVEAAGFCKGRSTQELIIAMHYAIEQACTHRLRLYVLFVDLSKCFMSFSRECGMDAAEWYGLPEEVRRALSGLYDSSSDGCVRGRYETAFGACEAGVRPLARLHSGCTRVAGALQGYDQHHCRGHRYTCCWFQVVASGGRLWAQLCAAHLR